MKIEYQLQELKERNQTELLAYTDLRFILTFNEFILIFHECTMEVIMSLV